MSCNHAHINFKFQPKKDGAIITIFSSLLLGKQGYCESRVKKVYCDIFIRSFAGKTRLSRI
jgi:hypothetical protein